MRDMTHVTDRIPRQHEGAGVVRMNTSLAFSLIVGLENLGFDPMKPCCHPTPIQQVFQDVMDGFSERQRAALKAVWCSRESAQWTKRLPSAKKDHTTQERRMAAEWGREHPGHEMVLMRFEIIPNDGATKAMLRGVDVCSLLIDYTLNSTQGSGVMDFSDTSVLAALGWPTSWAFPAEWSFTYRRTRIEGVPVLEVIVVSQRRPKKQAEARSSVLSDR